MKGVVVMAILLVLLLLNPTFAVQPSPKFEDYSIPVYTGKIHNPKWIRKESYDEWRDHLGKLIDEPVVNFSGKYFVTVHSCGTECGYYTMTDLRSGRELNLLSNFDFTEPSPKTRDGQTYTSTLITRANSKMLVAQYHVQLQNGDECRERTFVFDDGKITPITRTRRTCTKY